MPLPKSWRAKANGSLWHVAIYKKTPRCATASTRSTTAACLSCNSTRFARQHRRICPSHTRRGIKVQALVNNAGVMCKHFSLTCDGYETTIGVNFVGTYLLTKLLIPALSQGSNIVFTTSMTRHIGTVDAHSTKPRQPNMHASNTTPAQNLLSPSSPLTWQNVSPHKAYTSTPPTPVW